MSRPVTAVITTHRRPDQLLAAIQSVRDEVFQDFELIVVEDGDALSRDSIEGLRPGIRLIQENRLGVARARNLGLAAAAGELVIYLDDDDVALPCRIDTLVREMDRHAADLCFGMTRRRDANGGVMSPDVPTHHTLPGPITFCDLLVCTPHVNSVLARTELLRRAGGFDAACAHLDDWAAWLRMADAGARMWAVPDVVAEWRLHAQGLSEDISRRGLMKQRITNLCEQLLPAMSPEGAQAIGVALEVLRESATVTYDDYADAMHRRRGQLRCGIGRQAAGGTAG